MSIYFDRARELGEMLLLTEEGLSFEAARNAFSADEEASAKYEEFTGYRNEVQEATRLGKLDQESYNAALRELTEQTLELKNNPIIAEFSKAEAVFYALVNQTLSIIQSTITGDISEESSCGGEGCSSCAGCH